MFCAIDERMPNVPKHAQAKQYRSELVTIGVLVALKGGYFRAFYRWLARDFDGLFGGTALSHALAAPAAYTSGLVSGFSGGTESLHRHR